MGKRFSDTEKWRDKWFSELPLDFKMAYLYVLDNCDQVGVWETNFRLADFQIGVSIDWAEFEQRLGYDRLLIMVNGNWWLKKFCLYQYGALDESNLKSKPNQYYIKMLKSHSLWIDYTKTIYSPKEKDKDKEKDKEYIQPKDFLKTRIETELEVLNMGAHISPEDFEDSLSQWSLNCEKEGWEYSGDEEKDLKRLRAWFQKWLNSWAKNGRQRKQESKSDDFVDDYHAKRVAEVLAKREKEGKK